MNQTTCNILLVKPSNFGYNSETSHTNVFQNKSYLNNQELSKKALKEFDNFANTLNKKGVNVYIKDDSPTPIKPDAIFPNNWVTFHENGKVFIYPMLTKNRRIERRFEFIEELKKDFKINEIIDLTYFENENKILEGTGSIVFDHVNKIAYACLSPRTNKSLFVEFCTNHINYKPIYFNAIDKENKEIYHTNVMMSMGEKYVIFVLESLKDEKEKLINIFKQSGKEIIEIYYEQMYKYAGNMLNLGTKTGESIIIISQKAFSSLKKSQIKAIEKYGELYPINIDTIEDVGGGSVRCMIAEIFLEKINN